MAKRKTVAAGSKRIQTKTAGKRKTSKRRGTATGKKKKSARPTAKSKAKTKAKRSSKSATRKKTGGTSSSSRKLKKKAPTARRKVGQQTPAKKSVRRPKPAGKTNPATKRAAPRKKASRGVIRPQCGDRKVPKTHLSAKQLVEFRQLLMRKRAELAGDVTNLTDEVVNRRGRETSDHTTMPIHMAELGSDNWEKEFTIGLIANERKHLHEIDAALARIANKTYGVCLATHRRISVARLRAKPWAKYCIEYARAREEGRGH